jgi:haloalkane dehalogenase
MCVMMLAAACGGDDSDAVDSGASAIDAAGAIDATLSSAQKCGQNVADVLTTPETAFDSVTGYPFESNYAELGGLRVHYLDEGPAGAAPIILSHGEPTWSYLSRKMIPILTAAGHRVIAPDLVGFGKSDKPTNRDWHTYERHVECMHALIDELDLQNVTLFGQDWGGLIFLRVAAEQTDRFDRIVTSNTMLITGDQELSQAFYLWRDLSQTIQSWASAITGDPAYDAPFPDESYMAGPRELPLIVPTSPDDPAAEANRAAWATLGEWQKPFLTAFGENDPIAGSWDTLLQDHIPGTSGQPHTRFANSGHFVQEDVGEELAQIIVDFIADNP